MTEPTVAWGVTAPHMVVGLTGVLVLVADLVWLRRDGARDGRPWLAYLGIAGLAVAGAVTIFMAGTQAVSVGGTVVFDPMAVFFNLLFIGIGIAIMLVSVDALGDFTAWPAEYYVLVIWCTLGNMLLASVTELFTLFVCFQLTSLPIIALIGFGKGDARAREAGLKYLVIVLISTAIFLYGLSLTYGGLGTSSIVEIGALDLTKLPALAVVGLMLMLAGFGFKTTAAPFQHWVPDVYEGAPLVGHRVPVGRLQARGLRVRASIARSAHSRTCTWCSRYSRSRPC